MISGKIISSEIKRTDIITFDHDGNPHSLKITDINYVRMPNENEEQMGLSFAYQTDLEKEYFSMAKILPQIAIITPQE